MNIGATALWFFRRWLHERDGGACGICREPVALDRFMDVDHIVQIAEGGSDAPENLRCTHRGCNRKRPRIRPVSLWCELPLDLLVDIRTWGQTEFRDPHRQIVHILKQAVAQRAAERGSPDPT